MLKEGTAFNLLYSDCYSLKLETLRLKFSKKSDLLKVRVNSLAEELYAVEGIYRNLVGAKKI